MVGSCSYCLSCSFVHSIVLFLWLGFNLHDVDAVTERKVIHGAVGGTVEISANLPTEGVSRAEWRYEKTKVADYSIGVIKNDHFKDRLEFNQKNLTLTLRNLNPQDSGDFSFGSEVDGKQRETIFMTLRVHEPITVAPVLTYTIRFPVSNESCTVLLNCNASYVSVTYNLTVGKQSHQGSRLQYTINPQDGDTTATCTVSNFVSEKSAYRVVTCGRNGTDIESLDFRLLLSAAGGGVVIFIIIIIISIVALYNHHCKQKSLASDSNELTVYADISDVAAEDGHSPTLKPCSLYDTINDGNTSHRSCIQPQTVYDEIQLGRIRKASVSPYQEIS